MGLMLLLLASTVVSGLGQSGMLPGVSLNNAELCSLVLSFLVVSGQIWLCRGSVAAAKTKSALAAVFDLAPHCIDAKLLQAEMMLDDKDYGGVQFCLTPLHLLVC